MSNQSLNETGRRPISIDLQLCYSGFKIDELEYIDYSRSDNEPEGQLFDKLDERISHDLEGDILLERECDESILSVEDCQSAYSYLCSTPTAGRMHRGNFPQDDFSGLNGFEYGSKYCSSNIDSGVQTRNASETSIVSMFGEAQSVRGSIEDLVRRSSSSSQANATRRKIEIDAGIQNPYSKIDELDLSIEEEFSQMQCPATTTKLGTLRRRLSLSFRRTTSTGFFGSYVQKGPETPTSHMQQMTSSENAPSGRKPVGPMNFWFRKFRNRHFI